MKLHGTKNRYRNVPSDVKEVSGVTAVEGKDVHGSHGQSSAVHQASDVAIKLDEVEVSFLCLDLRRFFLSNVAKLEYIRLTELRIIVEAEFGVHATHGVGKLGGAPIKSWGNCHIPKDMAVRGLSERVDLDLSGILVLEDPVEIDEDVGSFGLSSFGLKSKLLRDGKGLLLAQTLLKVDGSGDNGVGVFGGDLLNVHTTLGRCNEHGSTDTAVVEDGDVVFVSRISAFRKHDL